MSPLLESPGPPLYQPARGLLPDGRARGGGQEGDGHAVSPPLPVRPGLGEDQQGVGAGVRLKITGSQYQAGPR